jgi:hypothetical protein
VNVENTGVFVTEHRIKDWRENYTAAHEEYSKV